MPGEKYIVISYATIALPAKHAGALIEHAVPLEPFYSNERNRYEYNKAKGNLEFKVVDGDEINAILVADRMGK